MQSTAIGKTPFTKLLRIMKMSALLILIVLQAAARPTASAQVTLKEKSASLEKVLKAIKKQSDYGLSYDEILVRAKGKPVAINLDNVPVEEALAKVFQGQDLLTYTLNGKIISVKEKKITPPHVDVVSPEISPAPLPPTVHGRITNEKGEAVVGVNISIKGGKVIGVTNDNGEFTLTNVPDGATLVFSAVNIVTYETKLNGRSELALSMKTKVSELDEMQVIAYGTQSKRLSVGNVSTVNADDIAKQPVGNPLLALQGRVGGLTLAPANGLAGSGITLRIQGENSLLNGNDPLYLIDGVPVVSQLMSPLGGGILGNSGGKINGVITGSGNPLSYLNPTDIESISVLKDADATAIYGSRAANGAILITTKKGKAGDMKVDVNLRNGWSTVPHYLPLMNTSQYLALRHEALVNDGVASPSATDYDINGLWDTTRNIDWQKELVGKTAKYQDFNATISGGSEYFQYLVGSTYHNETTVFPGDFHDTKASVHFAINSRSANNKFKFSLSGNYLFDNNQLLQTDLTQTAVSLAPNAPPIFLNDGSLNWQPNASGASSWPNPLAALNKVYNNKVYNLTTNAILSYHILPGLDLSTSFGYTNFQQNEISLNPVSAVAPENRRTATRVSVFGTTVLKSWIIEPQANYSKKIGNHQIDVLLGTTIQQNSSSFFEPYGLGFTTDQVMQNIAAAPTVGIQGNIASLYKYNALFSRINYSFQDKYLFNITARRDGSSRFGSENRFQNFGSIGSGWIFSEENLIKKAFTFLSFGKLRVSYGLTGSDQIGDYKYLSLYNPITTQVPYQGYTSLLPTSLPNPYIQWEETKKLQFGMDLGFLKDRLLLKMTVYRNRSSNLLIPYSLPINTGYSSVIRNFPATIQNSGFELSLNTINIKSKVFKWTSFVSLTIPQNKLIEFPNLSSSTYSSTLIVGQSMYDQLVYKYGGVNANTGMYQYVDSKGNLTYNPSFATDRTQTVNKAPKFYGGFENKIGYKSLELSFMLIFNKQIASNSFAGLFPPGILANQLSSLINRWQKPGDNAEHQKSNQNYSISNQYGLIGQSDAGFGDAGYIRLKNVSLSWQVPKSFVTKLSFKDIRLFAEGENLLTFTHYQGLDPEILSFNSLPLLRTISFGIHAGL